MRRASPVHVRLGREEPLPTVVKKLFGCEEEPEDATSDDGHLSSDDVRYEQQLSNNSSFTLTVSSSSNDSLPSDEEDAGKPDTDESSNQETDVDSHCNAPDWESSLRDENERLRSEVADLSSALVARDMEIASLRERCQFLMNAVEQQDEVIAKIYAAASNPPSATSPIPIPQATTVVESQKQRVLTKKSSKKKVLESVRRYPGNVGRVEPAREMLEAHLDSIGYRQQDAGEGLAYLSEGIAAEREKNAGSEVEILNVALDRLLFASPPKSEPLFIDTPKEDPRSVASSPGPTVHRRPPQSPFLERRGSSTSEEDFAKSAGFLRKANRKLSGRLSVSDFGLLGDETQLSDAGQSIRCNQSDESNGDKDGASERGQSRSASQRNLFAEIDVANREDAKRKKAQEQQSPSGADNDKEEEEELTYAEFLERLSLPASRDILDSIRMFVGSILGPRGDGKPPRHSDYLDYDFYGHHEFRRRYDYFFQKMDERLSSHPAWRHASEAMLSKARDGIEKYVMEKLSDIALHQLPECQQWKKEDDRLFRRMKLLSFVTPDMLDIKPCMRNEVVWSMAEDELRRINSFRAPGDKINCIVRCCSVIFSVLNLARGDNGSRPGADDFLPVFIYIVLHSQIPRLYSNCEYIAAYRNPADLMSKAGYCFVNLRSAIEFINVLDGSMLSISSDEFDRLYAERERQIRN